MMVMNMLRVNVSLSRDHRLGAWDRATMLIQPQHFIIKVSTPSVFDTVWRVRFPLKDLSSPKDE